MVMMLHIGTTFKLLEIDVHENTKTFNLGLDTFDEWMFYLGVCNFIAVEIL